MTEPLPEIVNDGDSDNGALSMNFSLTILENQENAMRRMGLPLPEDKLAAAVSDVSFMARILDAAG